ncbi:hypothetical protein [Mucilaginibacter aquaedulcis]|uniref:hypothetical protein n=1 Tax=Mucilaginibacter aquaedulcis TaxID=1187081 RepID=UPI0025B45B5E|nr:hypothetical protein [Mucilaginibacter aquaedulcis]MDN3548074.1 hypothetical protein [Mucilaginibacter aquaedulcis]
MPDPIKLGYENLKTYTKIPLWTYSGLLIIGLAIAGFTFADKQKKTRVNKMIYSLKKDDILEVKLKGDIYTLLKVDHVSGNLVYVAMNKYQSNSETNMDELKSKGYDTSTIQEFPVSQLINNDKIEILDIDRN